MVIETKGKQVLIDNVDWKRLEEISTGQIIFRTIKGKVYPYIRIKGKSVTLGRAVMNVKSTSQHVTYIDGDPCNVKRSNIVVADRGQVFINRNKQGSTSVYRGVSKRKDTGKWQAQFKPSPKHKRINLGSNFKTAEEAAIAYNKAAKLYLGAMAILNDI